MLQQLDVPEAPAARDLSNCIVGLGVYVDGVPVEHSTSVPDAARQAREQGGYLWLGLHEPTEAQIEEVALEFDLHPLAVEDAVLAHQRPKLERYDDRLFAVLKTCKYLEHDTLTASSEVITTGEVMVFVGPAFVITVRHGRHSGLHHLRAELEGNQALLQHGPAAVLYAVADLVVDSYTDVVTAMETDIDELEESVFSPRRTDDIGRIYQLKRELLELRRAVTPLTAPLRTLAERDLPQVPEKLRDYFRDIQDHAFRVHDQLGSYDDLLTSILQASLARVTLAENEDVRKISAWVAIAALPTAVAGIYGMNFDYMPELRWRLGYPLVMLVIVSSCLFLYTRFKRSGWL